MQIFLFVLCRLSEIVSDHGSSDQKHNTESGWKLES